MTGRGGWGWNEETKDFEQNPRYTWRNPGFEQADEHPAVNVTWNDARAFIAWLRQSPPGAGFDGVQIAGEPERKARIARERDGISLDDATWREIVDAGKKVGVTVD